MKYLDSKITALGVGLAAFGAYDASNLGSFGIWFIVVGVILVSTAKEISDFARKGNK